jgi:integrase
LTIACWPIPLNPHALNLAKTHFVGAPVVEFRRFDFRVTRHPLGDVNEKGGKEHDVPCHHNLDHFLDQYIAATGIAGDANGYLFRTTMRRSGILTEKPLHQQGAYRIIQKRAKAASIETKIGNHTFRATGITAYL